VGGILVPDDLEILHVDDGFVALQFRCAFFDAGEGFIGFAVGEGEICGLGITVRLV
jgi:hypothetical protein